ncbi:putative lipopolysaccharide heptosyltransferase III [Endozoicomonas sp. SCSIO W0465]|uniref:putative lipopolysaccharide heptosyltransferase III n=1 Tax=Endozoicomonas sp. SCSIO W0465 TaxID=2918516 RepID=UPI002075AADA|nr:putative lipopolysaccharide heptosyltransferase III [Endozoicomonas sp. SCSIO W0465]USE37488.1 putative lipopolysaccharide heptosyltransferase III [Endozoicomonas sp. SCSIO W0465]
MKILVTKFRNLGDVLLSTPLFASLKAIYPDSELHVSVNDFCTQVVADNPHVDKVIPYSRGKKSEQTFWQRIRTEIEFYWQFKGQYDLVINLTEGDRGCIISALSGASRRMGYIKKPTLINRLARFDTAFNSQQRIPTVQKDLQFAEAIDSRKVIKKVTLGWRKDHEKMVDELLSRLGLNDGFVVVHPVSRWMYKCWDSAKVAQCIDHIQEKWQKLVLLTTSSDPEEIQMANEIASHCQQKPLQLPQPVNLQAYAYLTSKACMFFGIDSAPMHIAASTDTPVIALFGASEPNLWGPWDNEQGSNYRLMTGVQHNGIHCVISNENMELYFDGDRKLSRGMMAISLSQVISKLDNELEKLSNTRQIRDITNTVELTPGAI